MGRDDNYGSVQRPRDGYSGLASGSTDYGEAQNPPGPGAQSESVAEYSTLTAGLGNGVNLQPSYYHGGNVDLGWPLMRQASKIKAVRIEIEPGQEANAQRWIKEAVSHGYTVIATYHDDTVLGSDDPSKLMAAAKWWAQHFGTVSASGAFAINLMNEWGSHKITPRAFADAYNKAIAGVRSVYSGPIIVDLPGWGQDAHTAALAITGANSPITDRNIILSAHIYPKASTRGREMRTADLDELASTGLACMVGEFGDDGSGGKTAWADLVKHAKSKGWPVFGWAWNGDGGPMNMITPQFQQFRPNGSQKYTRSQYFNTIYNLL